MLPLRVLANEGFQLAHDLPLSAAGEICLDAQLERLQTLLLESIDRRLRPRLVRQLAESGSAPEGQCLMQARSRAFRIPPFERASTGDHECRKPIGIERTVGDGQSVARRPCRDRALAERPS